MRTARTTLLLVLLLGSAGAAVYPRESPARLGWMAGCWRVATPQVTIDEQWMPSAGNVMLGMSRTMRRIGGRDSVVAHEFMRIFARGDSVIFRAHPSGQESAEFGAEQVNDSVVVFANAAHDFPQRIRYHRAGDSLHASIEGTIRGQKRLIPYPFGRVACAENKAR